MIAGLDSAYAPTLAQAQAAYAAGVRVWGGYLQTRPGVGILNGWSLDDFTRVRQAGLNAIAFCSGWDDPLALRALAAQAGVLLCLDVESEIRGDGPWVDGFLATSGAGLYGDLATHAVHAAPWRVAALYPGGPDPGTTWPVGKGSPEPPVPHGWQWQNTHDEFGISVDRGWYDDWFHPGGDDLTGEEHNALMELHDKVNQIWADFVGGPRNTGQLPAEFQQLQAVHDQVAQIWTDFVQGPRDSSTLPVELKPLADMLTAVKTELDAIQALSGGEPIAARIEAALRQA